MDRRAFLGALGTAAGVAVGGDALAQRAGTGAPAAPTRRRGRLKQGLWRVNFGEDTTLSFDDMCREAARLGVHGFDLIGPEDWPTLRRHGLEPLLVGTGGVTFEDGIIHPEVHDEIEASIRPYIDMCAAEGIRTIITIGGQRRGMPFAEGANNAVAFLNRIKSQLEDRGVTIAIENMNNRRTDPRFGREDQIFGHWDWGVDVCERVGSPNVKINWDLYHMQVTEGDLCRRLEQGFHQVGYLQIADNPGRNEPGTGEVAWSRVLRAAKELGYDGYVGLECRPKDGERRAAERILAADSF